MGSSHWSCPIYLTAGFSRLAPLTDVTYFLETGRVCKKIKKVTSVSGVNANLGCRPWVSNPQSSLNRNLSHRRVRHNDEIARVRTRIGKMCEFRRALKRPFNSWCFKPQELAQRNPLKAAAVATH